jgi:hypothetical protein
LVVVRDITPVAVFVSASAALAITAFVWSRTVPLTVVVHFYRKMSYHVVPVSTLGGDRESTMRTVSPPAAMLTSSNNSVPVISLAR